MNTRHHFAVCVKNEGYQGSLEVRKIYEALDDPAASSHRQLRIIDESGEDYLYPAEFFLLLEMPKNVEQAI